jgi:hypothetical protein
MYSRLISSISRALISTDELVPGKAVFKLNVRWSGVSIDMLKLRVCTLEFEILNADLGPFERGPVEV